MVISLNSIAVTIPLTICFISPSFYLGSSASIASLKDGSTKIYFKSLYISHFTLNILLFLRDMKWSFAGTKSVTLFGLVSVGFAFGMGGFIIYFAGVAAGAAIFGLWFFVYYGLAVFYFYKKNNSSISRRWAIATISLVISVCLIALIAAVSVDSFNDFLGFSISYLILNFFFFLYSYTKIHKDILESKQQPMFASPWIFPLYKYDSKIGIVKTHNDPFSLFLASCMMFLIWTIALTIWL